MFLLRGSACWIESLPPREQRSLLDAGREIGIAPALGKQTITPVGSRVEKDPPRPAKDPDIAFPGGVLAKKALRRPLNLEGDAGGPGDDVLALGHHLLAVLQDDLLDRPPGGQADLAVSTHPGLQVDEPLAGPERCQEA